jgi:hypothetical protein
MVAGVAPFAIYAMFKLLERDGNERRLASPNAIKLESHKLKFDKRSFQAMNLLAYRFYLPF